jgi:hypothetical protein
VPATTSRTAYRQPTRPASRRIRCTQEGSAAEHAAGRAELLPCTGPG